MAIVAIEWAFAQEVPVPSAKLVLLALADHVGREGHECWPSIERLAERTNLHYRTVRTAIGVLEDAGLIQTLRTRRNNTYSLAIGGDTPPIEAPIGGDLSPIGGDLCTDRGREAPLTVKNRNEPSPSGRARASRLPDDWVPDAELIAWVTERYPQLDWETANDIFTDHWRSSSGSTARKLDWRAAWRNWMRRDATSHKPTAYRSARAARLDGQARTNAERIDRALARRPSDEADDGPGTPRLRLIAGGGGNADG